MAAKKRSSSSKFVMKLGCNSTDPLIVIAFLSFFHNTAGDDRSFHFMIISKRCVLPLPWKVDHHQKNIGASDVVESTLREAVIGSLKEVYVKNHLLGWSRVSNLLPYNKAEESPDGSRKDIDVIGGIGFEETEHEYHHQQVDDDDDDDKDYNCLEQSCVMKMMENMGYNPGKGLGRSNQGPPTFIVEIQMKKCTFGLGYRPTVLDEIRHKEIVREKARHRANDIPFEVPMKPYPHTLNGQFVRAGETAPYWGFTDSRIVPSGWGDEF